MAKDDTLPMHTVSRETSLNNTERTLKTAVDELTMITKRLRLLSSVVAGATLLNMFWTFYIILLQGSLISGRLLLGIHAIIFLLCLLLLWQYDNLRRVGDSLFDEISDELQWYVASESHVVQNDDSVAKQRPVLHERVALRLYALTTNLPLSGRHGPAYYALLNITIWLITILFVVLNPFLINL